MTDFPADLVEVGAIADAYGVRGEVRIDPFNAPRQSVLLKIRSRWLHRLPNLRTESGPGALVSVGASAAVSNSKSQGQSPPIAVTMMRCRIHGSVLLAVLEGVADRDAALALKGARICVRRADFPAPAPGEVYWVDLLGCAVSNARSESLGSVSAIDDHGAHPILVVRDESDRERLIPYVPAYVLSVDVAQRRIVVDWELDY